MSDKFSVDDILKEIDGRRNKEKNEDSSTDSGRSNPPLSSANESPLVPPLLANDAGKTGLTAELEGIEKSRFGELSDSTELSEPTREIAKPNKGINELPHFMPDVSKPNSSNTASLSATQIIGDLGVKHLTNAEDTENLEITDTAKIDDSSTQEIVPPPPQPVQIKRFAPKKRDTSTKSKPVRKPKPVRPNQTAEVLGTPTQKSGTTAEVERVDDVSQKSPPPPATPLSADANALLGIPPSKPSYVPPVTALLPEEKERLQKQREVELLEKELAQEESDELLDGINPYAVRNTDTPKTEEIVNARITQELEEGGFPAPSQSPLAATTLETPIRVPTPDISDTPITPPLFVDGKDVPLPNAGESGKPRKSEGKSKGKSERTRPTKSKNAGGGLSAIDEDKLAELDITPSLQELNKSFAEKQKQNKAKDFSDELKTRNIDTLSAIDGKNAEAYKGKTIPLLNIDYKKQIIEDSLALPKTSELLRQKQLEEKQLKQNNKRKIRDFIYEDIDDTEDDDFYYEDEEYDEDFDSFDSSEQVWHDLNESHKGLKWRVVLLALLTLTLGFFTLVHDLGNSTPLRLYFINEWFGESLSMYATALVFANIIAGFLGVCLCSGAIMRGLKKLFTGKADCDSACAVPIILATISSVFFIVSDASHAGLQEGRMHIFVLVALGSLLFNTFGKLLMIVRTKRNFKFVSGDGAKYSVFIPDPENERAVRDFTKGILNDIPASAMLKKTEFLTGFIKNSYCTDWADSICRKLVPISIGVAVLMGIIAYILPIDDASLAGSLHWGLTVGGAFLAVFSPFTLMLIVNNPLLKASKVLSEKECVVMGYSAANKFSKVNSVVVDASLLFPPGCVKFLNVKRCQRPNCIDTINIDESLVIAASLAIKSESIMSSMFYDIIGGDEEVLYKIEGCVYEVNMGITGWMGSRRVMLGNREQMKHHGIDVPAENKERRHCPENGDVVYLAVGSESVAMFIIEVTPNSAVKHGLWELDDNDVVLAVKTKDSLVTKARLADLYDISPERIKILPFDQHTTYDDFTHYSSRGDSKIACNGTFTSFTKAIITAKNLIRDMTVTSATMFVSLFCAVLLGIMFMIFAGSNSGQTETLMSATNLMFYNMSWVVLVLILQGLRRY